MRVLVPCHVMRVAGSLSQQSLQAFGPKSPQPAALVSSLRAPASPAPAAGLVMMRMPPPPSPSSSVVSAPTGSALLLATQPQPGTLLSSLRVYSFSSDTHCDHIPPFITCKRYEYTRTSHEPAVSLMPELTAICLINYQ